jgi:hypothetical protein
MEENQDRVTESLAFVNKKKVRDWRHQKHFS